MTHRFSLLAVSLIALVAGAANPVPGRAAPPEYVLTARPARRVEAVQSFDVTYPKFKASEWIAIADTCTYEARQENDRHASAVCRAGKSDCGGLSVLFVAALRANGVPARSLVGNWAESAKPGETAGDIPFTQQHVRAEFFAAGVGWVPVDASVAALWFKGKREALLQQCFGYDAGNFLVKQVDYDLVFDAGVLGKQTVVWAWCTAWPVGEGKLTGPILKDDWQVRLLRAGK